MHLLDRIAQGLPRVCLLIQLLMSLDLDAKKTLLRKIPHGLFICGVTEGQEVNGFTASWVTQASFEPPLVVMAVRSAGSSHGIIERTKQFSNENTSSPMAFRT